MRKWNQKQRKQFNIMDIYEIKDTTKINDFKEVEKLELSKITRNEGDKELLTGLIISGFEMKFGKINENREMFESTCIDDYMQNYFVKNKLNVPFVQDFLKDIFPESTKMVLIVFFDCPSKPPISGGADGRL